jgi:L-lysine exporter family protein LysE/ArgO
MIATITQGFILGLAYAMPIGSQNLYVINAASRSTLTQAMRTALIFAIMDISLGVACILGVGQVIQKHELTRLLIGSVGAGFLLYIGYTLIRRSSQSVDTQKPSMLGSLWKASFLLTWCNPHALIDGSVLLGGYQSAMSGTETALFSVGLAVASSTWFISLSALVSHLKSSLNGRIFSIINRLCGTTMIGFGMKLAITMIASAPW